MEPEKERLLNLYERDGFHCRVCRANTRRDRGDQMADTEIFRKTSGRRLDWSLAGGREWALMQCEQTSLILGARKSSLYEWRSQVLKFPKGRFSVDLSWGQDSQKESSKHKAIY